MNDVVAIQYSIYRGMRSSPFFNPINVVLGREFLADAQTKMDSVWLNPRVEGGPSGVGSIVNIPRVRVPKPNSKQRERHFTVGVYEQEDINLTPGTGTMVLVDDWADMILDFLWNWMLIRAGGLVPDDAAIIPDPRFKEVGVGGRVVSLIYRQERNPPARCSTPQISANLGVVTIVSPDNSLVYYTTDGFSFPGPDNDGKLVGEQAAQLYQQPFAAPPSGTIILAMAHPNQTASFPSQLAAFQIP